MDDDEIERLIKEAEEFAEEDKAFRAKADARNKLEGFAYNMKNTIDDHGDRLDDDDKDTIDVAVTDAIDWLDANEDASADEYQEKLEELEGICNPIIKKMYKDGQGGPSDVDDEDEEDEDFDHEE